MIRYDLRCREGHRFEAWFRDSAAFEAQAGAGQVRCAICGGAEVEKAPMAPGLGGSGARADTVAARIAALRAHVERTADYVGGDFAAEARRIHQGEAERRAIWGEASLAEARALVEEGAPIAPLPFARRDD